jgi:hypothetical protein
MKSFWENDAIIWTEGIKQMDLVIKDDSGGGGHAHKRKDSEKFFPTKMRITMVQVSAGSKYNPSLVPNLPGKTNDAPKPKEGEAKEAKEKPEACCPSEEPEVLRQSLPLPSYFEVAPDSGPSRRSLMLRYQQSLP